MHSRPASPLALLRLPCVFLVLAAAASAEPLPEPAPSLHPRLVVFVSVDQMRADYLVRFRPLFTSGLKAVAEQGAVFTNARYRHACTETGPGHSVLLTGRSPRSSGIVGNAWYDRTPAHAGERRRATRRSASSGARAGPRRRRTSTASRSATCSRRALPGSKVVGVSFKDRAAILMAGKRADGAYWYEAAGGRFVTSSWYGDRGAAAGSRAGTPGGSPDAYEGRAWERLLPDPATYVRLAGEDDVKGEWDGKRHDLPAPRRAARRPRSTTTRTCAARRSPTSSSSTSRPPR